MPKIMTQISIFVASPSDLAEERDALRYIVEETNINWAESHNIVFRLVGWETDTRPEFGTDAQAVINDQIPNDYDVFIGILWARFGTPTPRYSSGTEEEFMRALQRRQESGELTPKIMVYFKDAPIPPSKVDIDQLGRVNDFRKYCSDQGGLVCAFHDEASFQYSLRAHLADLAKSFAAEGLQSPTVVEPPVNAHTNRQEVEDESAGLLDSIQVFVDRIEESTNSVAVIKQATIDVGVNIKARGAELSRLNGGDDVGLKRAMEPVRR